MGCQKEIARKIIERGGQYLLALKDNQPTLHAAVEAEFTAALEADVRPKGLRRQVTVETNRRRNQSRSSRTPRMLRVAGARDTARACRLGKPDHDRHGAARHARGRP
jgi:predicted transposase YbfD/YdcC